MLIMMKKTQNKPFSWASTITFLIGVILIVVSMILPPTGVIDPSVMEAAGLIFTFSSIFEALISDKVVRWVTKHGTLYIGDKDGQNTDGDVDNE